MANRDRETDCDATSSSASCNTVFIDTNLDTHLAMIVTHSDTVLHLKKKIMSEHPECFPKFGKIKINALKVKRKGFFYHLSDSMHVKSAFEGAKKCWFLSVDASSIEQPNENHIPNKPEAINQLPLICVAKTTSGDGSNHKANSHCNKIKDNCGPSTACNEVQKDLEMEFEHDAVDPVSRVFSDFNRGLDYTSENEERVCKRHIVSETNAERKGGDSLVGINDDQCNKSPEGSTRNEPGVNKKRKCKKDKTTVSNLTVNVDGHIDKHSSGQAATEAPKVTKMENADARNIFSEVEADHGEHESQVGVDDNQCLDTLEGSLKSASCTNRKHESMKKTEDSVSNRTVKDVGTDVDEHSSDKTVGAVLVDVELLNTDAAKGPRGTSFDDVDLRSNSGEFLKTPGETGDDKSKDAGSNAPPEEASKSITVSKKRKRRESKRADNPQEENNNGTPTENAVVRKSSVIAQQKNAIAATENLITETPEDVNLVAGTGSGKRKKKKKKSSRDQEVFVEPISFQIVREERCNEAMQTVAKNIKGNMENVADDIDKASDSVFVPESDVQPAIPYSAVDVDVMLCDVANAEVKSAASEVGPEKGTKKSKKSHSTKLNELPPPAVTEFSDLKEDVVISAGEDLVGVNHDVTINGPDKVKEQKELPHNCGTKEMVSEKCERMIQGGVDGQSKEAVGSGNLSETHMNIEPGKSAGSKRLKKRAKKPVLAKVVVSSTEYSDNSASGFTTNAAHDLSVEAKKMCNPLSPTKVTQPNSLDTSLVSAYVGGTNRLSRSEEEYLSPTQVYKSQVIGEIVQKNLGKEEETNSGVNEKENKTDFPQQNTIDMTPKNTEVSVAKPRKKMKKNQNPIGETHSASPIEEQKVGTEELISSNDRYRKVDKASETEKKSKQGKSSSKNQSTRKDLEPKKSIGDGHGSLTLAGDSPQAPSDAHKSNSIETPLEHVDGGVLHNHTVTDASRQVDVSKGKDDGINFKDHFSPRHSNHEAPPAEPVVNVVQKLKSSDIAVKAKKKTEVSVGNGSERKSHPKSSTIIEHKETKKSSLSTKKEIEGKVSLGNNHSTAAKSSRKRMGEVVNRSRREKSLMATPGSIFWDNSSESSEDSDTSTKAPPDNSSSSSDSTKAPSDNSSSSSDSKEEVADGARGAEYGRSNKETITPSSKRINMDVILRSSSRFKKAKLSAAQSQLEDMENQPVDFVPDSQPNQ